MFVTLCLCHITHQRICNKQGLTTYASVFFHFYTTKLINVRRILNSILSTFLLTTLFHQKFP